MSDLITVGWTTSVRYQMMLIEYLPHVTRSNTRIRSGLTPFQTNANRMD